MRVSSAQYEVTVTVDNGCGVPYTFFKVSAPPIIHDHGSQVTGGIDSFDRHGMGAVMRHLPGLSLL